MILPISLHHRYAAVAGMTCASEMSHHLGGFEAGDGLDILVTLIEKYKEPISAVLLDDERGQGVWKVELMLPVASRDWVKRRHLTSLSSAYGRRRCDLRIEMLKWVVSQGRSLALMATPRLRIRIILANGATLGPTEIALLEAIVAKGSITAAARSLKISYRYAWRLVQSVNDMLCGAAVVTEVGGNQRGGSNLTATGKQLVAIYHAIQSQAYTASFHELHVLGTMARKRQPSTRTVERIEKL